jgi:hypothetical protein
MYLGEYTALKAANGSTPAPFARLLTRDLMDRRKEMVSGNFYRAKPKARKIKISA